MAESKMPARIWAEDEDADKDSGLWCLEPYFDAAAYIRADLVEPLVEALRKANQFIINGIELGFIRMPDPDCPDPAHQTPGLIRAALAAYAAAQSGQAQTEARG